MKDITRIAANIGTIIAVTRDAIYSSKSQRDRKKIISTNAISIKENELNTFLITFANFVLNNK
jgi:hypothetical protein